jgi:hypothetical protein
MSSETSTERRRDGADAGLQPRHVFLLLSMIGATAAVMVVGRGHPLALVVLSLTVVAAGLVGVALQGALAGFFGAGEATEEPRGARATDALIREKALVLRSIKELEFDRAMGKIAEADFTNISTRLRARALSLMQELDRAAVPKSKVTATSPPSRTDAPAPQAVVVPQEATAPVPTPAAFCGECGTRAEPGQRFCKACGVKL